MTKPWLTLALALFVCAARAEGDEPKAEADAAFNEGREAFARNDFEACVRHFQRAQALQQHDAVRFNVAVCLERLERYREAIAEYQAAAASAQLDEATRQRAASAAEALRERLGRIAITAPKGAAVRVDGADACRAPCSALVDPGKHEVEVQIRGRAERQIVVVASGASVRVDIQPPPSPKPRPKPAPEPDEVAAGPLTWVGVGVAALGIGGIVGFGVRAMSVRDEFDRSPTEELADEGELMRNLANVSIGVAALGGVLIAVDLIWVSRKPSATTTAWRF